MSTRRPATRAATRARTVPRGRAAARRRALRRRRVVAVTAAGAFLVVAVVALAPIFKHAVRELTLPLRHEDIIVQQARAKHVDAALIAAVIMAESKFNDSEPSSAAGAVGLMQMLPSTAEFLAHRTGGTQFRVSDLGTPQVNITYGTYYLRYLLDEYGGNTVLAIAAYNGGETNVGRWLAAARAAGHGFSLGDIPFSETRAYVSRVLDLRERYRHSYARELGY
jgi:soluble lytic murein transglycosylase